MSETLPKNHTDRLGTVLHIFAVFALILEVLSPLAAKADITANAANSSPKTFDWSETTISESAQGKLLGATPTPDRVVQGVISAYTSTPGQTDSSPFYGATGKHVYDGMIAVNGLPFGTKIKIPSLYGDKIFTVDDRMNRRYTCQTSHCHMDIWLDTSRSEAMKFGVKHVEVQVFYPSTKLAKI